MGPGIIRFTFRFYRHLYENQIFSLNFRFKYCIQFNLLFMLHRRFLFILHFIFAVGCWTNNICFIHLRVFGFDLLNFTFISTSMSCVMKLCRLISRILWNNNLILVVCFSFRVSMFTALFILEMTLEKEFVENYKNLQKLNNFLFCRMCQWSCFSSFTIDLTW